MMKRRWQWRRPCPRCARFFTALTKTPPCALKVCILQALVWPLRCARPNDNREIKLSVAGLHNVQNALAAAARGLGIRAVVGRSAKRVAAFVGVRRRLESHGEIVIAAKRVLLIDDYAHHPTELKRLWMLYAPLILIVVSCWFSTASL